ncbi:trypsin-like serine protease, partial [Myxococcota bacterium]
MRFFIPIAVILSLMGCSEPAAELRVSGRPIVGGEPDTNPAHMATVALTFGEAAQFFCSGTLISDTVVLTAGHCVDVDIPAIKVYFGESVWVVGDFRQVEDGMAHPGYQGGVYFSDIALLRLESPAPAGITPIPHLPRSLGLTQADERVTTVDFSGFGVDEFGTSGVKLHAEDVIDVVCDGPDRCADYVNPHAFGYDQQPGGPCFGDSGGPSYLWRENVEYVAGVTSYGDRQCAYYGASTTADRFAAWIDAYVIPEDCANAIDDDFDALTDCGDPECAGNPACPEDCANGTDDEPDGDTDCADADCALHPLCLPDACEDAPTISCGDTVSANTRSGTQRFERYDCMTSGSEDGPEMAYRVDAPSGTPVTAILHHDTTSDLDLFLLPPAGASCDTGTCLDSSLEGLPPERVDFLMPADGAFLVVETYDVPTSFELSVECGNPVELCEDGADNDDDGDTDCDDADCANDLACLGPANLSVEPLLLDITASQDADDPVPELTLHNTGGLSAVFSIAASEAWIDPLPLGGTLKPVTSRVIKVRMDAASLSLGVHQGSLEITAAGAVGSPITIPVSLELVADRPVPPVTDLQIERRDQALSLTWTTPADPIVNRVIIRRSQGVPPTEPDIGEAVYTGLGEELLDSGLQNGATYCYSAFATDASNRFADPASACAIPGENRPPPVPEPLSPADGASLTGVPVLVASAVADPEGDVVTYTYQLLAQNGSTVLDTGTGEVSGNRVNWTPAYELQYETIYLWQVEARDSH